MARKAKSDVATKSKYSPEEFTKFVGEADRQKELAADYQAGHGNVVRNGVERLGLDKQALGFARRLHKTEAQKAQATFRAAIRYAIDLGVLSQLDAFDDTEALLEEALELVRSNKPNGPASDAALSELSA